MKNLDFIAEELFNKIRGRFPSITIGDEEGKVTDQPSAARFFDFQYKQGEKSLGSVSVTLTDESVQVMYNNDFVANEDTMTRNHWYDFLKELRMFAKKRLLNFDTRNINKSNLDKRDYQFLARQRNGDEQMNEAKLYGTSRKSYQDIGRARVTIEHTKPVNQELAAGRTQYIGSLFIESSEGERFKYPFRHLNGARAMARHVSEGGVPHDDFGKYIVSLSEELASLRKFKTYMSRSAVMAEGLSAYSEAVIERIDTIKNTVEKLQRESHYNEAIDTFETAILEDVPTDVAENWIDQLTIRQFNEELKDVFPYIYKLVSEKTVADELGPDDLAEERVDEIAPIIYGLLGLAGAGYAAYKAMPTAKDAPLGRAIKIACDKGDKDACDAYDNLDMYVDANDQEKLQQLVFQYVKEPFGDFKNVPESTTEDEIENAFEELMGQFAEGVEMCPEACCGKPVTECSCGPDCPHCDCYEKNKMNEDEVRGMDGDAIMSWYNKYEDYPSYDAYGLADGFFKFFLDSGIPTDAMEKQECFALIKKFGSEEFMEDPLGAMEKAPKLAPITTAMFEEFKQIAGPDFGEEEVRTASRMLDNIDENRFSKNDDEHELNKLMRGTQLDPDSTAYLKSPKKKNKKNKQVGEGIKKGDTVMVNDEQGPGQDFSAPGVIIGLSSKRGKARVRFGNNKTEILPIDMLSPMGEGNEFAQKVQQMKAAGAKKGDKFKTSDGKEHTLEDVTEYVLSMYDRETGQFPKGETAVLTAIEKDFGEQYINPAKQFIEMVNAKFEQMYGYKDTFESQMQEALQAGDEKMLMDLYNTYKDNKMIPKKYRDLMGRVKDELTNKKPAKAQPASDKKDADPDLEPFGGKGPEVKTAKADTAKPKAPTNKSKPNYDASGSEVTGNYGMQKTAYDPDYSGPEGYLNDAEAIEGLMSKSAMSSEENQWLQMAYRKYGITKDNLGQVLKDIRQGVAQKAAADVRNFDQSQESIELERIRQIAGIEETGIDPQVQQAQKDMQILAKQAKQGAVDEKAFLNTANTILKLDLGTKMHNAVNAFYHAVRRAPDPEGKLKPMLDSIGKMLADTQKFADQSKAAATGDAFDPRGMKSEELDDIRRIAGI